MSASARYVVDASAIAKLLLDEPESEKLSAWMQAAVEAGADFYAPDLLDYEIASLVARVHRGLAPAEQAYLVSLAVEHVVRERPLTVETLALARKHRLTPYDASYLALAKALETPFATADAQLAAAATIEGVKAIRSW